MKFRFLSALIVASLAIPAAHAAPATAVSISGDNFRINGQNTYAGTSVEGLLLNSRMVNGIFTDANANTVGEWAYPDEAWNAGRNTSEFIAKMPTYASKGLNMVTVGMQGGMPWEAGYDGPRNEVVTGFTSTGTLKATWTDRLALVIEAADANGIVVEVSLYYVYQDQRVGTDAQVESGAKALIDWITAQGYTNVLIEVCNECNLTTPGFQHANLRPADDLDLFVAELNDYTAIPVSTSFTPAYTFTPEMIAAGNFVTMHCSNKTPSEITAMVQAMDEATTKPVVLNECGSDVAQMNAAVAAGASWGYYDQGDGSYTTNGSGFQSLPTKWGIGSPLKTAFFDRVAELT